MTMGTILILFIATLVIFGALGLAAYKVASDDDEEYGDTGMSKNTMRLLAWGVAILICLAAAFIEWKIIFD